MTYQQLLEKVNRSFKLKGDDRGDTLEQAFASAEKVTSYNFYRYMSLILIYELAHYIDERELTKLTKVKTSG